MEFNGIDIGKIGRGEGQEMRPRGHWEFEVAYGGPLTVNRK